MDWAKYLLSDRFGDYKIIFYNLIFYKMGIKDEAYNQAIEESDE